MRTRIVKLVKPIYLAIENFVLPLLRQKKYVLFVVVNELMLTYASAIFNKLKHEKRIRIFVCIVDNNKIRPHILEKLNDDPLIKLINYKDSRYKKWDH